MRDDPIRKVLLTDSDIRLKIIELSDRISYDYITKDLVIVALLKGSVLFLADLIRYLDMPLSYDFIGVESYLDRPVSNGEPRLTSELTIDIKGRDVLLIDDILDTGRTIGFILEYLKGFSPRSIKTCVLLDKKARREVDIKPDYKGFTIEDQFVVGYGLDYKDRYRNLPYIAVIRTMEDNGEEPADDSGYEEDEIE